MPQPRNSQINLVDTPYYHCVSRCVRRAFLCGEDKATGKSYQHRRQWVESKILFLTQVFAIDVCAYAVMSNHTHIIFHVNLHATKDWNTKDILFRWHKLFKGTLLTQRFMNNLSLNTLELTTVEETALVYKERLTSISWFMRVLNESIAREANKEDNCTGRFWEGRFKSQALLDEAALISCMAYVDLNPIRANMAKTPKTSKHTSISSRIKYAENNKQPTSLMPFVDPKDKSTSHGLQFKLQDYIELIHETGQCFENKEKKSINNKVSLILEFLGIRAENWLTTCSKFEKMFHGSVGRANKLFSCKKLRRTNLTACRACFN